MILFRVLLQARNLNHQFIEYKRVADLLKKKLSFSQKNQFWLLMNVGSRNFNACFPKWNV